MLDESCFKYVKGADISLLRCFRFTLSVTVFYLLKNSPKRRNDETQILETCCVFADWSVVVRFVNHVRCSDHRTAVIARRTWSGWLQ